MAKILIPCLFSIIILFSCTEKAQEEAPAFEVYCEMVANDAKPLALHRPLKAVDLDLLWDQFNKIAEDYNVKLYREDSFPNTWLFPEKLTEGEIVVIIYKGDRLTQYEQFKADFNNASNQDTTAQLALARRFGRLLGYSPHGINQLLSDNTYYKTLASYRVEKQFTHLYYDSLDKAALFYRDVLGLKSLNNNMFQISQDTYIKLNKISDQHPADQPKSTAIALLTDQLPQWYEHIQNRKVPIKYTYKPGYNPAHDGFVAIDPGGYLLEFEQFKQHPENELFMAVLAAAPRVETQVKDLNFYGSITWTYHKDLLKMQGFYENVLGYQLVADQGWTKIYQTSATGFIGLVDERRGMENYAKNKAVELEWTLEQPDFDAYAKKYWTEYRYNDDTFIGPELYNYRVSNK